MSLPAITAAFVLSLLPLAAMAAFVGGSAVSRRPPAADMQWWFPSLGVVFVVVAAAAIGLRGIAGFNQRSDHTASTSRTLAGHASTLLMILGVAPLVAVTLFVVAAALKQSPILGPEPDSWFARAGLATSYAVPVLVTALTLIGYAVRERSSRFAFAGGLVLNLGVTAAYLLAVAKIGLKFDVAMWVRLAQLNAIASASFALAWIAALEVHRSIAQTSSISDADSQQIPTTSELLVTQVCIPVALNLLILAPTWLAIFFNPSLGVELAPIGNFRGWIAAGLALAAVSAARFHSRSQFTSGEFAVAAFALATLAAAFIGGTIGNPWSAFHVLLIFHIALIVGLAVGVCVDRYWKNDHTLDWRRQLGSSAIVASDSCRGACPASLARRSGCSVVVGGCAHGCRGTAQLVRQYLAATWIVALCRGSDRPSGTWLVVVRRACTCGQRDAAISCWLRSGIRYLACVAGRGVDVAGTLRISSRRRTGNKDSAPARRSDWPCGYRFWFCHCSWRSDYLPMLLANPNRFRSSPNGWHLLRWQSRRRHSFGMLVRRDAVGLLYCVGLIAAGILLDVLDLNSHWMIWLGTITLATYTLATSFLWSRRAGLARAGRSFACHARSNEPFAHLQWLVPVNLLLTVGVVALTFAIELTFAEAPMRLMASKSVLASIAVGLLARGAHARVYNSWP